MQLIQRSGFNLLTPLLLLAHGLCLHTLSQHGKFTGPLHPKLTHDPIRSQHFKTHMLTLLHHLEVGFLQNVERHSHPPLLVVNLQHLNRERQILASQSGQAVQTGFKMVNSQIHGNTTTRSQCLFFSGFISQMKQVWFTKG